MPDIFLSYSRDDQVTARVYAEALTAQGFDVWWDATLKSGEAYDQVTEKALREAKAVVVLWSAKSVQSRWVRAEATLADRNKTLVPVMIEPCERPIMFELTQSADLTHWRGAATDKVWVAFLADVRRFVETLKAPQRPEAPEPVRPQARSAQVERPSILVLPFTNMSGDPEQDYFSDGVTEDIITDLGKVSAMSVVSRNTAFAYKGKTAGVTQIAQALNVSHILEGSVRKSGNRVRITAQLLHAATDAQVWAERFDRTLDDIFAIQAEISEAIVSALKLQLAPKERKAIEQKSTASPEAYKLYLMARQFSRTGSERHKELIVRICRRALEIDPEFARAWALMVAAQAEMHQRGASADDGREAAERAVALDPNLAEAHAARANVFARSGDMNAALKASQAALKLDADCFDAHVQAGYACIGLRQFENAVAHFEKAIAIDPDSYYPAGMVIQAYEALGDAENLKAAARRLLARVEAIVAVEPDHGAALGMGVRALASLGEIERAQEWTDRAVMLDPDNARLRYNLACAMATVGAGDAAADLLDPIIMTMSDGLLQWMDKDNDFDLIRNEPRFVNMMERGRARFLPA